MLIAVTGASGFVGGHVADRLAAGGHEVVGFGRRRIDNVAARGWRDYRRWDLTSGPLSHPGSPDAVVHCAGTVSDWGSTATFIETNVQGTRTVMATFPASARFVHLSTASVYDPWKPKCGVTEDAPLPNQYLNAYALSKRLAEEAVQEERPDYVILRPHAVYGPGDPTLLPRLLAARRFGRLVACGNGRNHLSMTHVDNLADAVQLALTSGSSGIFNVADAETPTLSDLLGAIDRATSGRGIVYLPRQIARYLAVLSEGLARMRGSSAPPLLTRYAVSQLVIECTLDISRATRELGYRPARSYEEAMSEALSSVPSLVR